LIETVLLDPKQFFGSVPFPSVAYDEPTYDPRGYWRGRAWPHISYWLVELLHRYGYPREADAAADRVLAWQSMYTGHRETLCTDPTESEYADGGDFTWVTGRDYDYNWGAASVYMLAGRHYRRADLNPPEKSCR
jgi:putative isomerase